MQITLNFPNDLAIWLRPLERQPPQLLELGLREVHTEVPVGFQDAAEVMEFFAKLPSNAEILAFHPSQTLQAQVEALLDKHRTVGLTSIEEQQWQQYEYLEHLVRLAKLRAYLKLQTPSSE